MLNVAIKWRVGKHTVRCVFLCIDLNCLVGLEFLMLSELEVTKNPVFSCLLCAFYFKFLGKVGYNLMVFSAAPR